MFEPAVIYGGVDVCVEDLLASAVITTGLGEELAAAQAQAQQRLEAASVGWQGLSAPALSSALSRWADDTAPPALSSALSRWADDTAALLQRLAEHAVGLERAARALGAMEDHHAAALR